VFRSWRFGAIAKPRHRKRNALVAISRGSATAWLTDPSEAIV